MTDQARSSGERVVQGSGQAICATLPAVAAGLPGFLPAQRWFGNKERPVERVEIRDTAVVAEHPSTLLAIVDVFHEVPAGKAEQAPVAYFLPLSLADAATVAAPPERVPGAVVVQAADAVVQDGIGDAETCRALLRGMLEGRTLPTAQGGQFVFQPAPRPSASGTARASSLAELTVRHVGVEQSNSSVIFGTTYILKALRRLSTGTNPEIEIPAFLGQYTPFDRVPALIGWAEYQATDGTAAPVGVLQQFVANQGDGWSYVLRRVANLGSGVDGLVKDLAALGRTLAELHLALASRADVPDFAPEPIAEGDLDVWRNRTLANLDELLARDDSGLAVTGADRLRSIVDGIGVLADGRTVKTRHHGDFHLGQTLVSESGWILIDFEGEPLRSLAERRAKQTPLRDVAGLLRSLDYARATAVRQRADADEDGLAALFERCRAAVLTAYVETIRAAGAPLLPANPDDLARALLALETEKALYELTYELGNRPDWASIPLSALARLARSA